MTTTGKQLFTTLESDGTLTVEIAQSEFPDPTGNQVLVKMEAAPINPSDLAILTGAADFENADYSPPRIVALCSILALLLFFLGFVLLVLFTFIFFLRF
mgnify:CR=1 FL=1